MNKTDSFILAIDQGTTGSTVALVDGNGRIVEASNFEFPQHFPQQGWVEHNAEEIWESVIKATAQVISKTGVSLSKIISIGITNQRETVVAWDKKTLKPLGPAIVWQCRRTTSICQALNKKKEIARKIRKLTGLVIDPYFSGTKMMWILKNNPEAKRLQKQGRLAFGTMDSYLVAKLTGGVSHVTDVSNASRTLLMDLKSLDYHPDLLKIFGVQRESLPEIRPSASSFGKTKGFTHLPDGVPITGIAGDQQSALFGQTCFKVGECKITFGTGSFLLVNTGHKPASSRHGLLTTVGWQLEGKKAVYALEGGAFICGAAVQWLRDQLGFIQKSSEVEALALEVETSEGVEFVPALTGLGAPHWSPDARGMLMGLTRGTRRAHIARATLEAMALQNVDIMGAMAQDLKKPIKILRVDGGASSNNLLMQMQSDFSGVPLERPKVVETTVLGAAYLAGLGVGLWTEEELLKIREVEQVFKPQWPKKKRELRQKNWAHAIKSVNSYAQFNSSRRIL